MPEYTYPGVYIEEIDSNVHPIEGVSTTTTTLVGFAASGPLTPVVVTSFSEYQQNFGLSGPGQYLCGRGARLFRKWWDAMLHPSSAA